MLCHCETFRTPTLMPERTIRVATREQGDTATTQQAAERKFENDDFTSSLNRSFRPNTSVYSRHLLVGIPHPAKKL